MSKKEGLKNQLKEIQRAVFGLDLRSLGMFRVFLGMALCWNHIIYKLVNFSDIYAPSKGLLGNGFMELAPKGYPFSWLQFIHSDIAMLIVFMLTPMVYLLFSLGYKPQLTSLLSLIFFGGISMRYFPIRSGWDYYFYVLIALSIFLPVGHYFSCFKSKNAPKSAENRSGWAWLMIVQIGIIYTFAGLSKFGNLWQEGKALWYLCMDTTINTSLGERFAMRSPEWVLKLFTYLTKYWEILFLPLLFLPYKNQNIRMFLSCSIVLFHFVVNLFTDVGHFKWAGLCAAILLMPSIFWEKMGWYRKFIPKWERGSDVKDWLRNIEIPPIAGTILCAYIFLGMISENITHNIWERNFYFKQSKERQRNPLSAMFPWNSWLFKQAWSMYSPNPNYELGKLTIEGLKEDGQLVDLITGRSIDTLQPRLTKDYGDYQVRKLMMNKMKLSIQKTQDEVFNQYFFNFQINKFVAEHPTIKLKEAYMVLYSWDGRAFYQDQKVKKIERKEYYRGAISY
ncbi:MAG: HTTM domain-containing protein [Chitinophagales bacterium]|nr:HTTM domain-containing protein [Chitinophagales bacterium]